MNRDLITKVCMFATGAAIGSVVTWQFLKTKYENLAQEEIESVREYYAQKNLSVPEDMVEQEEEIDEEIPVETKRDYNNIIKHSAYTADNEEDDENEEEEDEMNRPYAIAPEESWEQDYPTLSLTYYEGDGVLVNDQGEVIDNVDELVGEDFADHFGEYEDDSVFIRNDAMEVYYEILRDLGSYSENS